MVFSPIGSAPGISQIHPQAPADEGVIDAHLISTVVSPQIPPVYTNSTPMATYAQGNFMSRYPVGWNPTTGLGMPPEFMISSPSKQPRTSASQPMNQQENASAPQLAQPQDSTLAPQPAAPNASAPQSIDPTNMSATKPTPHQ